MHRNWGCVKSSARGGGGFFGFLGLENNARVFLIGLLQSAPVAAT